MLNNLYDSKHYNYTMGEYVYLQVKDDISLFVNYQNIIDGFGYALALYTTNNNLEECLLKYGHWIKQRTYQDAVESGAVREFTIKNFEAIINKNNTSLNDMFGITKQSYSWNTKSDMSDATSSIYQVTIPNDLAICKLYTSGYGGYNNSGGKARIFFNGVAIRNPSDLHNNNWTTNDIYTKDQLFNDLKISKGGKHNMYFVGRTNNGSFAVAVTFELYCVI